MIRHLTIENFRRFRRFEMEGLGRVNLLVGENNCGKTTVLEAIQLLATQGDVRTLAVSGARRGEFVQVGANEWRTSDVEIRYLFFGRSLSPGSNLVLRCSDGLHAGELSIAVVEHHEDGNGETTTAATDDDEPSSVELHVVWEGRNSHSARIQLTRLRGISFDPNRRSFARKREDTTVDARWVSTASLNPEQVLSMMTDVMLTPHEDLVVEALRAIEPTVERIAPIAVAGQQIERSGIVLKCSGLPERVPIGNMGDGIWRLLGIALSLVSAQGGLLLIDEIDTGLHHTVLTKMWRLVAETARKLDVQVFATTHSRDCYESLAAVCREDVGDGSEVTIHRIEKDAESSVRFSEREIVIAAERDIEVR